MIYDIIFIAISKSIVAPLTHDTKKKTFKILRTIMIHDAINFKFCIVIFINAVTYHITCILCENRKIKP